MTSYEKVVEAPAFPKPSAGPDMSGTLGQVTMTPVENEF